MWVRLSQNYLWLESGIYTIPCDYTTSYKRLFVYILTHYIARTNIKEDIFNFMQC